MNAGARMRATALCAALALTACSSSTAAPGRVTPAALPSSPASVAPGTPAPAGGPVTASSVTSTPVRTVDTGDGTVGYRSFGAGPALLLITGFSASIDSWDPTLIALLAGSHRVVVIDNAGVGKTAPLRGTLTVEAMAQQTSAFIHAMKLGKIPVLGWSMGGMIAQALAVLHPDQVSSLVLAATFAGNGKAKPVPSAAVKALSGGQPAAVLSVLFPKDQSAAATRYGGSVIAYPGYYQAPTSVAVAQGAAIARWLAGTSRVGHRVSGLHVPTLVADGSEDAVDPAANDHQLAVLIPGATLHLYPDAGHAFLFQEAATFAPEVTGFAR